MSIFISFTYPIITVLIEPLFISVKLKARHIIFGILILIGVFFLVPNFDFNNKATQGLLMGLFSALAYFKKLNFKETQLYGRWINTNDLSTLSL